MEHWQGTKKLYCVVGLDELLRTPPGQAIASIPSYKLVKSRYPEPPSTALGYKMAHWGRLGRINAVP